MGRIQRTSDGARFILWSQTLVGRDPQCSLVLDRTYVSALHARILWDDARGVWMVEAIDSRTGTHYRHPPQDFAMLRTGDRARRMLSRGDQLLFGEKAETWELEDDASPFPEAQASNTGRRVPADGCILRLPSSDNALVSIYFHEAQGTYVLENPAMPDGAARPLQSNVVEVSMQRFEIFFDAAQPTARPVRGDLMRGHLLYETRLGSPSLVYAEGAVRLDLGSYACFGVVGKLLDALETDRARGVGPEGAGWRTRDSLHVKGAREAATQELWRCQQQLRSAGLLNVESLFEKRQGQGLVRLEVEVRRGASPRS